MKPIEATICRIKAELDKLNEQIQKADVEEQVTEFVNKEFAYQQKHFEYRAYRAFTEWVMKNKPFSVAEDLDIDRKFIDHIGTEFGFDFDKYIPR